MSVCPVLQEAEQEVYGQPSWHRDLKKLADLGLFCL